jgi:hypothetical protein
MLDHPMNPLQSPFAPSFLATYRCASGIIKSSLNHYDRFPELCGRWWGVWTHCKLRLGDNDVQNADHASSFSIFCSCQFSSIFHITTAPLTCFQIIVGCIVTRSPSSSMASSAFIELGLACDLFEKGAVHSRRARSGLVCA